MPAMLELDATMREAGKGALEDKEETNPKTRRTGGGEADGGAGKKKLDNVKKNGELKTLLTLMIKTQLRSEQRLRELEGVVLTTFVGAASDLFLNEVSCQTQAYQAKVKGNKKHDLGPPHVYAYQGFLDGLVKHHQNELGGKNQKEVLELKKKTEEKKWEEVADEVGIFRISKTFDKDKRRLTLAMAPHLREERLLICSCLNQLSWDKKEGRAPPSHMERELQAFLEELAGK